MSTFRYARQPLKRSHLQRRGKGYSKYRACLRLEFAHRCAYCGTAEVEVRPVRKQAGFEIDHFRPQASFPGLAATYQNLYWACPQCNRVKAQKWPTADEIRRGYRFVDPCLDTPADHLEIEGDRVVAKTPAGEYTIDEIQLNSVVHVRNRAERQTLLKRLELLISLADDEARKAALAMWAEAHGAPWDGEVSCPCAENRTQGA
jgi:uncharacterized protein (TIGR02646 family)